MDEIKTAHYYLYADCKTPNCKARLWLAHFEMPDSAFFTVDYPDEWFPVKAFCGLCSQTHPYTVKDIRPQSSLLAHHPEDWKPILPDLPVRPRDVN